MNLRSDNKPSIAVIGLKGLPALGGAATVGENLIKQLQLNYKFTVLSVETHADSGYYFNDVEQVIFKKFPLIKLNVFFYYLKSAFYVLFKDRFDLVHLHHTDGAFIMPLLKLKYKVVLTSHARPQENAKWQWWVNLFFQFNELLAIKLADRFTVVSKQLRTAYRFKYKRETTYIPNGVDLKLRSVINKDLTSEPYILFAAGRIITSKGLHILIKALKEIGYKGKLLVAGNLNQIPSYKSKILDLATGLDVNFMGMIKEKKRLLNLVANAKLFVYPTMYEAMSIMLLEAALAKTPIVCSDIQANTNVFTEDEVTFFPSGNSGYLAKVLQQALVDEIHIVTKAERAFIKLQQVYNWDLISDSYDEVYSSLLNQKS